MTLADENQRIKAIHAQFNLLTGSTKELGMREHYAWQHWLVKWNEEHLKAVVLHTRTFNRRVEARYNRSMLFKNMIENTDKFSDWLDEAETEQRATEARKRVPQVDHERKFVLEATGRSAEPEQPKAMTPAQVMSESKKLAAMLKEWREKNLTEHEEIPNQKGREDPTQATRSGGGSY